MLLQERLTQSQTKIFCNPNLKSHLFSKVARKESKMRNKDQNKKRKYPQLEH